jgi:hypothetical protein
VDGHEGSPRFNDVADFVCAWRRLPAKRRIVPETQFERDLGITGDDGVALLEAVQKKFGVDLTPNETDYRRIFGLGPNEYLFNGEGFGLSSSTVWAFTVGELHDAIRKAHRPGGRE